MTRVRWILVFLSLPLSGACAILNEQTMDPAADRIADVQMSAPTQSCGKGEHWCLVLHMRNVTESSFTIVTDPLSAPPKGFLINYWFQFGTADARGHWTDQFSSDGVSILEKTAIDPGAEVEVLVDFPGETFPLASKYSSVRIAIATEEGSLVFSEPLPAKWLARTTKF